MPIANFEQLCAGLCELAGIEMPPLARDDGMWSATLCMRGVDVTLMQYEDRQPGAVFLIADFGPMPEELGVGGWLTLLDANLLHSGADSPSYGRNPETGHVLLQMPVRLDSATAGHVHEVITALVETALQWRHDSFGPDPEAAYARLLQGVPAMSMETDEWLDASRRFEDFYLAVSHILGRAVPEIPPPAIGQARVFREQYAGVGFTIVHATQDHPDFAWVVVHFGETSSSADRVLVTQLMDANFTMLAGAREAKFSRIKVTGELVLQYGLPLRAADARQFLSELAAMASMVTSWARHAERVSACIAAA
jgi:hypothetical protein